MKGFRFEAMGVDNTVDQRLGGARWGMIADDLTGACDAAVVFARQGFGTRVLLAAEPQVRAESDLTVLSTDSRDDAPGVAAAKVSAACRWMQERGISVLFKKIDSVLRGNIRAEVEAVMVSGGFESAVLTPAFPALGRTVHEGQLRVAGREQAAGASLATMFSGSPSVRVADAATDDDLRAIARTALRERPVPLLAGSGGLAGALAQVLGVELGRSVCEDRVPCSNLPPWMVIGTEHPVTLAQVEYLKQAGVALREVSSLDPGAVEEPQQKQAVMLLRVPAERFGAATLRPLLEAIAGSRAGSVVVSGGDTARLLCDAIGAEAISLRGEVLAGVPWGRIEGGCADGMTIVTKSGGFGEPDALTKVVAALWQEGKG